MTFSSRELLSLVTRLWPSVRVAVSVVRLLLLASVFTLVSCSEKFFSSGDVDSGESESASVGISSSEEAKPLSREAPPWYVEYGFGDYWQDSLSDVGQGFPGRTELPKLYARGDYLVKGLAACGVCHGQDYANPDSPLSGGRAMHDRFGSVSAANITPDKETGIGAWSLSEIMRAMRASLGKNAQALSIDVHQQYRWMANRDAEAIAVYLLSQKPVFNKIERRELSGFQRRKWGIISQHSEVLGYVPAVPEKAVPQYGLYLASHVAGCRTCHTPGGEMFDNPLSFAGNEGRRRGLFRALMQLGETFLNVGEPSDKERKRVEGMLSPEGREIYREGLKHEGEQRGSAGTKVEESSSSAAEFGEEEFPVIGPDIRGTSETGLIEWTNEDIVNYLSSGKSPRGTTADPKFCPWTYYSRATIGDKRAIALYLKTQ